MRVLKVIIFTAIISCSTMGVASEKTVSLAVLNWEPYVSENLETFGFGSQILTAAFNRAGYKVTFNFMPWVRVSISVEK